jgi:hypothetical protein
MFHNAIRSIAFVSASIVTWAALSTTSHAQSPTDNASNTYEYNAYVYSYCARSMVYFMPQAIENQIANTSSASQRNALQTELFWVDQLQFSVDNAFKHALAALNNNDDSQWNLCTQDLITALDACDLVLAYQDSMVQPSQSRINSVSSCKFYLEIAVENSSFANLVSTTRRGGGGGTGGRRRP